MLFWFLSTSILTVWYIFKDPRFDYRLLLVGSLLPDVIDAPSGQARWAHSVTISVAVLAAVMLATTGRKPIRKTLLALPIGMLLHLVFDGAFSNATIFWWPFLGSWGQSPVPSLERGWLNVPMELIGLALMAWMWRRFGLQDVERRQQFIRNGTLTEVR